jgi:hypothetical protein
MSDNNLQSLHPMYDHPEMWYTLHIYDGTLCLIIWCMQISVCKLCHFDARCTKIFTISVTVIPTKWMSVLINRCVSILWAGLYQWWRQNNRRSGNQVSVPSTIRELICCKIYLSHYTVQWMQNTIFTGLFPYLPMYDQPIRSGTVATLSLYSKNHLWIDLLQNPLFPLHSSMNAEYYFYW